MFSQNTNPGWDCTGLGLGYLKLTWAGCLFLQRGWLRCYCLLVRCCNYLLEQLKMRDEILPMDRNLTELEPLLSINPVNYLTPKSRNLLNWDWSWADNGRSVLFHCFNSSANKQRLPTKSFYFESHLQQFYYKEESNQLLVGFCVSQLVNSCTCIGRSSTNILNNWGKSTFSWVQGQAFFLDQTVT